ncbi:3-isopropylmalate dehydratase small subunit [soil metagenome]
MPEPIRVFTSRSLVLTQANIDTDQIIPARFLTTTEATGLGAKAFYDWRYESDGSARPEAVLNRIDPAEHRILVAGDNFGCGSSREHAPWALYDYGFRAVISTGIADIFTSNALKNGLLPIVVDQATWDDLVAHPEQPVTVDLEANEVRRGNHPPVTFAVEAFARQCLLDGVDTLGWLRKTLPEIQDFERRHGDTPTNATLTEPA